jgi:DNA-binding response OmpR family regulator
MDRYFSITNSTKLQKQAKKCSLGATQKHHSPTLFPLYLGDMVKSAAGMQEGKRKSSRPKEFFMFTVYVVEDDKAIREELAILLSRNEYVVLCAEEFDQLVPSIMKASPDIVLLDLNLPFVDGQVICRELRRKTDIPLIIVTSRDSDLDELTCMNLGADDFVAKPYSPQILLARIANVLKRVYKKSAEKSLTYKGLELLPSKCRVIFNERSIELTKNEMRILQILMEHVEEIVTRTDIQNELWQSDEFIDDNTLTVNVNRLRTTLAQLGANDFIHTKRGLGYTIQK